MAERVLRSISNQDLRLNTENLASPYRLAHVPNRDVKLGIPAGAYHNPSLSRVHSFEQVLSLYKHAIVFGTTAVVLYSIVLCSHVRFKNYNECCCYMRLHVRIPCESLVMDVTK